MIIDDVIFDRVREKFVKKDLRNAFLILTIINLPRIIIGFSESERKNTKFNGVNLINYTLMSCLDIFHFSIPNTLV